MDHYKRCPMPVSGGGDCWSEPHPASRFGLCEQHWRDVVQDWVEDAPYTTRSCPRCSHTNRYETVDWASAACGDCGHQMDSPWVITEQRERQEAVSAAEPEARGVVYYLSFGGLVKIGFSASFSTRMTAIPHDEVLATEPGDYRLEKQRHREFAAHLVDGQREWFAMHHALLDHIAAVREQYGEPWALAHRIAAQHSDHAVVREFGSFERFEAEIERARDE